MTDRAPYPTRPGGTGDLPFLWEMLYEASHHGSLSDPEISRYLEGWGRPEDAAVVALDPAAETWRALPAPPLAGVTRRSHGFAVWTGTAFVVGGGLVGLGARIGHGFHLTR